MLIRGHRSIRDTVRCGAAARASSSSRGPSSRCSSCSSSNPRQVLTRSIIFERVWGYDFGVELQLARVYIGYLRRKTEAGGEPRLIHTVRGVGYALRESGDGFPRRGAHAARRGLGRRRVVAAACDRLRSSATSCAARSTTP